MQFPERDMQINSVAQLQFLAACREFARGVRIVYAGTRQVFGAPRYLPVDEEHPIQPVDFNGIHKYAATTYHMLYTQSGDLDAMVLRLTNVYGPRMALDVPCQGFLSTFLRRLLLGQELEVFGDGEQLRDPIFVEDAVDAFLLAGTVQAPRSRIYNVGGLESLKLSEIARFALDAAGGKSRFVLKQFPQDRKAIDIGSYTTDSTRIAAELGWRPGTAFREGMARTLAYYRENLRRYLDPDDPYPECRMPEHKGAIGRLTYHAV
jgi:nucleoside-diphosphate-sugar epimerase